MKFFIKNFFCKCDQIRRAGFSNTVDLVTFTEEILNEKLHFSAMSKDILIWYFLKVIWMSHVFLIQHSWNRAQYTFCQRSKCLFICIKSIESFFQQPLWVVRWLGFSFFQSNPWKSFKWQISVILKMIHISCNRNILCKQLLVGLSNVSVKFSMIFFFNSWRRPLPYKSQSIDLLWKSMDWFLCDRNPVLKELMKAKFWKNGFVEQIITLLKVESPPPLFF